jgi:hypothetical protein
MPSRGEREHRSRSSRDLEYGERRRDDHGEDHGHTREGGRNEREGRSHRDHGSRSVSRNGSVNEGRRADRERYDVQAPNGSIVLEGYREDILNGFEEPQPRYNPVSDKFIHACFLSL